MTRASVWYNPELKEYTLGETGPDAEYICKKGFDAPEGKYLRAAAEMRSQIRRGGVFDLSDVTTSTVQAVVILDKVLGTEFREYRCREAFQAIKTPELVLDVDLATKFSAQARVKPLVEADISKMTFARTNFDLATTGKNVSHILLSDEAGKKSVHDVLRLQIENAARALKKLENTQLAAIIEGATDVTGEDWGAINATHGMSSYDPTAKIQTVMTTIWDNGFEADTLIVHPQAFQEFMSNTFIHNLKLDVALKQDGRVVNLVGFPVVNIIIDAAKTATIATVASKSAGAYILADGPTEAAQYRDELRGAEGYVIRQWCEGKHVNTGAARDLTGITA